MVTCLQLSLPAVASTVREVRQAVAEIATEVGMPEHVVEDARLCVSEAVTNVVRHAYAGDGSVDVSVERAGGELTVVVRDGGAGLSEFRQDGELGYGLRIIEELTSRLVISSTPNAGTEVRMVFAFGAEQN